ncbi:MAG: choice-of-anchor D domain-containing protein [Akkermansiaceae bacterium]|nr:choice-of-anchor D domain-containing protein [Akkermansiaceae bacterium]
MKTLSKILVSCLTLGSAHAELVAHWPLDTNALDATGNGYDGAVVNGTVNFGEAGANANTGTSASFPDTGRIDVPFDEALNPGSFTVALWANAASSAGFASPVTSRDDVPGTSVHGYILYNDSAGNWNFWSGTGGGPGAWHQSGGPVVALNTWTHLAISYDAVTETKSLWVNGVIAATESSPGLYSPNGTVEMEAFHIGAGQDNGENFYFDGQIDDVGVWDEALDGAVIQSIMDNGISSGLPDPALTTPNLVALDLDGTVQSLDIPITNDGQSQSLSISEATFDGDANFSVTTLPGSIAPGGTDNITISFDPLGGNGEFSADLEITSNDSLTPVRTITVRGAIHDPMLVSDLTLDLGNSTSGSLTVTNNGASRDLNISNLEFTGPDADHFNSNLPAIIAAGGGSETLEVTFDSLGQDGTFTATLEITSDDPLVPVTSITVIASVPIADPLVAWWPLDVDGTDASGNGFDGTITGALAPAEGANAATGGSLTFDGGSRIDVPFDQNLNPDDFTITMWANASSTAGFASPITSRDDVNNGVSTHGFIIYNDNGGNWNFWTGDGNPGWDTLAAGPVLTDTWTHLAISYDSVTETKNFYVDGVLAATDTAANQYSPNGTVEMEDLHIGAGADDGNSFFFDGRIDDVGLFRTALSEEDINSIMMNGVGGFTGAARDLVITDLSFGPGDGQVTITFDSASNATYAVERSTDLLVWDELTDNLASAGEVTTFTDFSLPAGTAKVFYRVTRL